MPDKKRRSPARLLAPLALVAFVVALFVVLGAAGEGGNGDGGSAGRGADSAEPTAVETTTTPAEPAPRQRKATYTVEAGDTLGAIAEETGVPVETLEELNPELDPQALVTGQKIKLRE